MSDANSLLSTHPLVFVGLGNPGNKYEQTRHNIGFAVIDQLARRWQISLNTQNRFQGIWGQGIAIAGHKVHLLKPQTYMNRSGLSVRSLLDYYKLPPAQVLVIYDDMDLPLGRLRLRLAGSAGGHNGMKSIIQHLGTSDFPRLRIGIGRPARPDAPVPKEAISHVLGRFDAEELRLVPEVLEMAADAIEVSLRQGLEKAMSLYNGRTIDALMQP